MTFDHAFRMLASALAIAAAAPANAATLVQTINLGLTTPLIYQLFDPTFGTLQSARVEASSSFSKLAIVANMGSPATYSVTPAMDVALASSFFSGPSRTVAFDPIVCAPACPSSGGPGFGFSASASGERTYTGTDVQSFVGAGALPFYLYAQGELYAQSQSGNGMFMPYSPPRSAPNGTLTITYDFTPSALAVPEPAVWGMMILGFGLAGVALRRRAAAVRAPATSA